MDSAISYSLGVDGWTYSRQQWLAISCFSFWKRFPREDLKNLIGVEDQNADTVKEECRTVSKSQYLDEKKNSAIVPDNYSAMRDPLSSLTLESICDEEYLLCEVDS